MLKDQANSNPERAAAWTSPKPDTNPKDIKQATTDSGNLEEYITETAAKDPVQPGFLSPTKNSSEKEQKKEAKTREKDRKSREKQKFTAFGKRKLEDSKKPANQKNADKKQQKDKINLTKQFSDKVIKSDQSRKATDQLDKAARAILESTGRIDNPEIINESFDIQKEKTNILQMLLGGSINQSIREVRDSKKIAEKAVDIAATNKTKEISNQQTQEISQVHNRKVLSGQEIQKTLEEQAKREGAKNHPTPIPMNPEMNKQKDSKAVTEL